MTELQATTLLWRQMEKQAAKGKEIRGLGEVLREAIGGKPMRSAVSEAAHSAAPEAKSAVREAVEDAVSGAGGVGGGGGVGNGAASAAASAASGGTDALKTIGKYVGIGALLSLGGAAAGAVQQGGQHFVGKMTETAQEKSRHKRYKAMLKADPTLKEEPDAPKFFALLDRASPYVASEPYVAAATIQSMVATPSLRHGGAPAVTPRMIQEILQTEAARQATRFPLFNTTGANMGQNALKTLLQAGGNLNGDHISHSSGKD